ncbi:MAG: hypothetical protein M2R45_04320 [Verrucomicrobia subdivision 3 bacterium]|nr:hypothetical protein [Limisphaerales bacterium]MCS1417235.1 hypothetical protein [Limisphaerales bacterium]
MLYDIHGRTKPIKTERLLKELEQYRSFFIENPVARVQ